MLRRIAGREGYRAAVGAALAAAAVLGLTAPAQALDRRMRVPVYRQQLRDDCEAASLRMLLAYRGRHLGDAQLLARIGVDRRHPGFGRSGPRSGDPYRAFVGDPDGSELRGTGYGVYYPRIAAAARAEGATVLFAGEHYSPRSCTGSSPPGIRPSSGSTTCGGPGPTIPTAPGTAAWSATRVRPSTRSRWSA
ncbi:C39 family peptidase [Streptacidiphilus monticola]